MGRRGFFGRTIGALLGAMFPSLFLKKLPSSYRYDILYGTATVNSKFAVRLTGTDYPEDL